MTDPKVYTDKTKAGKPKLINVIGECIATAPDATWDSESNFKRLEKSYNLLSKYQLTDFDKLKITKL
jgi:hypothetical protein